MNVIRTPDRCFVGIEDYPFEPNHLDVDEPCECVGAHPGHRGRVQPEASDSLASQLHPPATQAATASFSSATTSELVAPRAQVSSVALRSSTA